MTITEFIETAPTKYGFGNANIIFSSSVDVFGTAFAPYSIQGMTVPFIDKFNRGYETPLLSVNSLRFEFSGSFYTAKIIGKQKRDNYIYYQFEPFTVNYLPTSVDDNSLPLEEDSDFILIPYSSVNFNNSDYNPLLNNSEGSKPNSVAQVVDRQGDAANPTNLGALTGGTAVKAELQDCSYTKVGLINSRYNGSKATTAGPITEYNKERFVARVNSGAVPGYEPALGFKKFKGSIHPSDADTTAIKAINQSDRELVDVYFNSTITGTHPNKLFPNFPIVGNFLYVDQGNRLIRSVGSKVYAVDTGQVFVTNELGSLTSIV